MRILTLALTIAAIAAPVVAKPALKAAAQTGLTGMWLLEGKDFGTHENNLPLSEAARDYQKAQQAKIAAGDVIGSKNCEPNGVPTMMANEFATEFLETPGRVTIVNEAATIVRTVYLGQTSHKSGQEPSWNGHSIGHWEGKGAGRTLVVDTVNFNDKAHLLGFIGVHSSTTHLVERFHVENGGKTLVGQFTFEDPRYLIKPWTATVHYRRLPADAEFWEYACEVGGEGWADRFKGDAKPAN